MRGSRRAVAAAALLLPVLSGCVAAAALPVLAAGGLVKTQADGESRSENRGPPRVAIPADPLPGPQDSALAAAPSASGAAGAIVRDYAFADGSTITVTTIAGTRPAEPAAALAAAPVSLPRPPSAIETEADLPKATFLAGVTELPSPAVSSPGVRPGSAGTSYAQFAAFAREQAALPATGAERRSAILANSGRLAPETRECSIHPAAVLIDLDPAGGALDTARPVAADPALATSLAELRREGVEIGWVSSRTADRAGAIRKALAAAGLDPDGRDQLVLLRFGEERKQTRREDFAKAHCVIAIAGDERADFDELFAYLRDPNAATPLDTLIGKGWFLVPPPLD